MSDKRGPRAGFPFKLVVLAELLIVGTSLVINLATDAVPQEWSWARDWRYLGVALFTLVTGAVAVARFRDRHDQGSDAGILKTGSVESSADQGVGSNSADYGLKFWGLVALGISVVVILAGVLGKPSGADRPEFEPISTSDSRGPQRGLAADGDATPPFVYQGSGDDVVDVAKAPGIGILEFDCLPCGTLNTIVRTDGPDFAVVNRIGAYKGKRLIDSGENGRTTSVTVHAGGPWALTISSGLGRATRTSAGAPVSGEGDDVILIDRRIRKARFTNRAGYTNFIVKILPVTGGSFTIPINVIGNYNGTVLLDGPAVVEVTSSGRWTMDTFD